MESLRNPIDGFSVMLFLAQVALPALIFLAIRSSIAKDNKILKKNQPPAKKANLRKK